MKNLKCDTQTLSWIILTTDLTKLQPILAQNFRLVYLHDKIHESSIKIQIHKQLRKQDIAALKTNREESRKWQKNQEKEALNNQKELTNKTNHEKVTHEAVIERKRVGWGKSQRLLSLKSQHKKFVVDFLSDGWKWG